MGEILRERFMNWILFVAIGLVVGGAFLGFRAGLIKTVFSLISTIVVIIVTMIFSPVVTNLLKSNDSITSTIQNGLNSVIDLSDVLEVLEKDINLKAFIDELKLPDSIKENLTNTLPSVFSEDSLNSYTEEKLEEIETYICSLLTETILNAVGFFVTFLIASIGVAVLCFTLDIISRLPVLHQINILAGAGAGALEGLMILWIGFIAITMLGSTEFGQNALGLISESSLLSFLYDNNIVAKFIL